MNGLKTFKKGGIHPPDRKHLTNAKAVKNGMIAPEMVIPLSQHLGSPAECLVEPGDRVHEGMLIGKSSSFISAQIHSSVPGVVKEIRQIYLPNGMATQAVVIEVEGEFAPLLDEEKKRDWRKLSKDYILDEIADKGVVGMGGATFPAHVKFMIPKGKKVEVLVINGAECEPYLSADHRIMVEKSRQVIEGINILCSIVNPDRVVIGVEKNKPDGIAALESVMSECDKPASVVPLKLKYPQGDEKQLLKAVLNREVPSGALPIEVGAVVSNIGTTFAVYEAVVYQKPVVERVVTVSGSALEAPANLKVRIGTPIGSLIEECGGLKKIPQKIVVGGPMMGFSVYDLSTPVTKGTSGILALTAKEVKQARTTNCLQCGRCVKACPMGLNPTNLFKSIDYSEYQTALDNGLLDCKECGCCSYTCPAHIPLVHGMRLGKRMTRKKKG